MTRTLAQQIHWLRNLSRNRLRQSFVGSAFRKLTQSKPRSICFVAATRLSEKDFWDSSLLGRSLKLRLNRDGVSCRISFENKAGLPNIYNQALETEDCDIIVFCHDDVWLDDTKVLQKIRDGLDSHDIIGVAGNTRRTQNQPAWLFTQGPMGNLVYDGPHLSGSIMHGQPGAAALSEFGPSPSACELMDGVFLAANRQTLISSGVLFDLKFQFHFYDMDFCRQARLLGLSLSTWPISLIHLSAGGFGGESWEEMKGIYLAKWTA